MNPTNDNDQKNDLNFSFDLSDDPQKVEPVVIPASDDSGLPVNSNIATPLAVTPVLPPPVENVEKEEEVSKPFPQPPVDTIVQQPSLSTEPVKMKKKSKMLPIAGGVLALMLVVGVAAFASNTQYFLGLFRGDIRPFASEDPCEVNDCRATGPNTVVISGGGNSVQVPADGQQAAKEALDNGGDGDTARDAADAQASDPDNPSRNKKSAPKTQEQKEAAAKKAEETKKKAEETLAKKKAAAEEAKKKAQDAAGAAQFAANAASQQQQAASAAAAAEAAAKTNLANVTFQHPNDQAAIDAAKAQLATAQTVAAGAQNSASAAQTTLNNANKAAEAANAAVAKEEKKVAAAQKVVDKATAATEKAAAVAAGKTGTGGTGGSGGGSTTTKTASTAITPNAGQVQGTGDIASCIGLGGGEAERLCYASKNGSLSTEICLGKTADECAAAFANDPNVTVQVCSGEQDTTGDQTGEFTACGADSTGGCGQVDILDKATGTVKGFVIDKRNCTTGGGGGGGTTRTAPQACSYVKLYTVDPSNSKKWKQVTPVAAGSEVVVDDANTQIAYTAGWTAQKNQNGFNAKTEHVTNKLNKTATYSFSGTSVTYAYGTAKNYGKGDVFIDGQKIDTLDLYSAAAGHQTKVYDNLSAGPHTIKVSVTGTKNASSKNTYISVDSFTVKGSTGLALNIGETLRLAVKGNRGRWSKARFTINGATPVESTTVVSGEYVYDYKVAAAGDYTIQAEILPR